MSELRTLLDAATPVAPPLDASAINRRVARRRRRRQLARGVTVMAAAAAALVAGWPGDDGTRLATDDVGGMPVHVGAVTASDDGQLFVAGSDDAGHYVAEVDPTSGRVIWRTEIPGGPPNGITFGLDRLWVQRGGLLTVDPETHLVTTVLNDPVTATAAVAFTQTYAWIADAGNDRLVRIGRDGSTASVDLPGMPDQLVVSDDGTVWTRLPDQGKVVGVVLDRPEIAITATWAGPLLAGANLSSVWSTDGEHLLEVDPGLLATSPSSALRRRIPISGVVRVVRQGDGLVVTSEDHVWFLSGGDIDLGTVDPARALALEASARSIAVVVGDVWYVDGGGRLVPLPRSADDRRYELSPSRTARGTKLIVRGRGDPRRGEDLLVELGGEAVQTVHVDEQGAFAIEVWVLDSVPLGSHDVRVGDEVVGTLEVVPAEVGAPYRHLLYTHCGIVSTHFDGRLWLPERPPEGSWWDENDTPGTLTLQGDGSVEFRADSGPRVRFLAARANTADPGASCE